MGVWQHDRVEIIPNDMGNRTTPSYVAFTDNERLIGDAAKNQVLAPSVSGYATIGCFSTQIVSVPELRFVSGGYEPFEHGL